MLGAKKFEKLNSNTLFDKLELDAVNRTSMASKGKKTTTKIIRTIPSYYWISDCYPIQWPAWMTMVGMQLK